MTHPWLSFIHKVPLWIKALLPCFTIAWIATGTFDLPVLGNINTTVQGLGWLSLWMAIATGSVILKFQAQIHQEREKTEQATRTKEAFLAVINHEIRTPLNGMIGVAELLRDQNLPPELKDGIQTVHLSGQRMLTMLTGIDDLVRITNDNLDLHQACFDLPRCIEDSLFLFQAEARDKGIKISTSLDPAIPDKVIGDESRLRYVLIQLLDNAVKFSQQGVIAVDYRLIEKQDHRLIVQFTVRDQGCGIAESQVSKIFKHDFLPSISSTRQGGNIGHGLPLCARIVELLGGTLWVDSEKNLGSSFSFTIQLVADERLQQQKFAKAHKHEELRVLVAEDNPVNQKVILALLRKLKISAELVKNGALAVDAARKDHYDLIFMDIEMPELDGISATEQILKNHGSDQAPVIVPVTATVLPNDTRRFADAGMTGLIQKPVTVAKLRHHVDSLVATEITTPDEQNTQDKGDTTKQTYVNFEEFKDLCGDDLETQQELIALFIEEGSADLSRIHRSAEKKQFKELQQYAHRLVGASRTMGARDLADLCAQIELQPHIAYNNLSQILENLDKTFHETCKVLQKMENT